MLTQQQMIETGEKWAKILMLRPSPDHPKTRYNTAWGDKTPLGLYHTINRLVKEAE